MNERQQPAGSVFKMCFMFIDIIKQDARKAALKMQIFIILQFFDDLTNKHIFECFRSLY